MLLLGRQLQKILHMLRAHSHQEQTFDYFASFLRNLLSGEEKYKALVDPMITDAQSLAKQEKDYFAISRNGFEVIVYLAKKDPHFFSNLNLQNLSPDDYKHTLDLITKRDLIIAE
jgi:hypothetical protein